MDVVGGAVLAGAAATGAVVVERARHRGSADEVREDVTTLGEALTDPVADFAGLVGHIGTRLVGRSGPSADDARATMTRLVNSAGHAVADGAGRMLGAYAGVLDRVLPGGGEAAGPSATRTTSSRSTASSRSKASAGSKKKQTKRTTSRRRTVATS